MTTPNLSSSAIELGWAIEKQTINPVELVEACIESVENNRIAKTIYSVFAKDRALNEAKEASIRAKNGQRLSLLDGVPISWKDLFDTEGIPTEGGTKFLAGRVPKADAEVVRRCANAGLVCLGKTHLSELAFSGLDLTLSLPLLLVSMMTMLFPGVLHQVQRHLLLLKWPR